jgi:hypothetical protein
MKDVDGSCFIYSAYITVNGVRRYPKTARVFKIPVSCDTFTGDSK